jgi:hypothetical protein
VSRHFFAIDPGEAHCGFAWFDLLEENEPTGHQCDCMDHSSDYRLSLYRCMTFKPYELAEYLETNLFRATALIIERFQLYPWMARQQGFSEFGTSEAIGIYSWIARKLDIKVVRQDAAGNKKDGRAWAEKAGFKMVNRKLGSGKWTYFGPDFDLPGQPHRRDAAAHGLAYLCGNAIYVPPAPD